MYRRDFHDGYETVTVWRIGIFLMGLAIALPRFAVADEPSPVPLIGLQPGTPDVPPVSGAVMPSYGEAPTTAAWQFDFNGLVVLPLRVGIGERANPGALQKKTTLHAPPRVPGDYDTFGYTSVIPTPWAQLNFSYGNENVSAMVIVAARTITSANGYFHPPDMLGINDAYLTFRANPSDALRLRLHVGGFTNRYGAMGEYDAGRYNTPVIARVSGTGFTGSGEMDVGEVTLLSEVGFQGQLNKTPVGVEPAGWNGFADPNVGSSFAVHAHAGATWRRQATLGVHYVHAFTRDDRAAVADVPDGSISVIGLDGRVHAGRFGHLYLGFAHTKAEEARAVSSVIRILNAPGGPGLMREYLGEDSNGTGTLNTLGGQYDFSLGNLLRYPSLFAGNGPDLTLSLFGLYTRVSSPEVSSLDGVGKLKLGGEVGYAALRWLGFGARYDHVMNHIRVNARSMSILTGRVLFRSDWNSRDQLAIQYSWYRSGAQTAVREGYPPRDDYSIVPDAHVIAMTASMWW